MKTIYLGKKLAFKKDKNWISIDFFTNYNEISFCKPDWKGIIKDLEEGIKKWKGYIKK